MQNSPLKNEKKDLVKKDGSQLKTTCKRQKKKLKKGKEIRKMKKGQATNNKYISTFTFLYRFMFC